MIRWTMGLALAAAALAACAGGDGGREIVITQRDDGCTPARIDAMPGENLKLTVRNEATTNFDLEGIEGARLDAITVLQGKERTVRYSVPDGGAATHRLRCFVPGGAQTIIDVVAGGGAASSSDVTPEASSPRPNPDPEPDPQAVADSVIHVRLFEYTVTPDFASAPAGNIRFEAVNRSQTQVHELAVLRVLADGSLENRGEIEDIAAGGEGKVTLELEPGTYVLACLIVPGEAGSEVDHFAEGMRADFTVE
jgi:hypothetical protein